ncbi:outer membrane protein [Pseudooceanicola sediminis]|nr:outer membrane beta-barrel protein [Pseudooceanicola sediminis]|tara:strand:- start:135991 stop:136680 length:690 start_codon:yes stop_codon:yes gene_type:complete
MMQKPSRCALRSTAATIAAAALLTGISSAPARAEIEVNLFTGYQTAPHSRVKGTSPTNGDFNALIGWEGKSFDMPPYYGVRATWWRDDNWGVGLEFTHDKVYADEDDMAAAGFSHLEFTDGLNIITVNASRRWQNQWGNITPYVSGGIGISIPHVEVTPTGGQKTFEYQYGGPAMRLTAGASYPISDQWSLFGEYQFTASRNETDLSGGGNLDTRIFTNALNVGVGFRF